MTEADRRPLATLLGVDQGVVALVGAGGKTTLAHRLVAEGRAAGLRSVLTTTTKMGADQEQGLELVGADLAAIAATLDRDRACLVVGEIAEHKLVGVSSRFVDELATSGIADLIAVEADGARKRLLKAPAEYEPVVPASSAVVVAVMSATALGHPIESHAHRAEVVAALAGVGIGDTITPEVCAAVLTHPDGGRKGVPAGAGFVIAVTRADARDPSVRRLSELVDPVPIVVIG